MEIDPVSIVHLFIFLCIVAVIIDFMCRQKKCRQRTLESAQAEYEAMDARSFVVALQLEAAGLKTPHNRRQAAREASPVS